MYRQNYQKRSDNGRRYQGGGNRFNRYKRARTIDPSFFVQKASASEIEAYSPKHTFQEFEVDVRLKENIRSHGYETPTPIQDEVIPHTLAGRDVVGIAGTGTGKTAAFLIPLVNRVLKDSSQKVLIITPTRELATQIESELRALTRGMYLYSVLCIGGVGIRPQVYGLSRNFHFVIGTPGRLQDLERQKRLTFGGFKTIVLDEVDRMLDMGFVREVSFIVSKLASPRQSLFFSATITDKVRVVMKDFLHDPVTVAISATKPSSNVDQDIVRVGGKPKIEVLYDLLSRDGFDKVLVFGRTKHGIEKLARELDYRRFRVSSIHGNKSQNQRQRALADFKENRIRILLATDVAARGLDIDNVTHVINYDQPESYEDYIHRIGRTGRANKRGVALTFVD